MMIHVMLRITGPQILMKEVNNYGTEIFQWKCKFRIWYLRIRPPSSQDIQPKVTEASGCLKM